ncbi:MAG: lamin tail domain-containing protein, partial [Prevotellaceae bacterium]|nr:lamin tail domain-containing protein [Prevotellaceae bacterium]
MVRRICLILWMYCFSSVLHSQISYDFESGFSEWIQKPVSSWELTSSAISGNFSLRHSQKSPAGPDTIFVPVTGITFAEHDVTWKFLLKHTYNPSNTNKWAVILAANNTSGNFNGYALGVNMRTQTLNDDILCLYRVNNGAYTEIIRTDINWQTSITTSNVAALEIRRNHNNYWHVGIGIGNNFSNISFHADSVLDAVYSDISRFGILYTFTVTAATSLFIDDISINSVDRTVLKASDTEIIPPYEQTSGGDISSLEKDTIEVLRFDIHDIVDSDTLPTYLHQITVKDAKPPSHANWKTTIKNAYLHAENIGNLQIANTAITDDSIVFHLSEDLPVSSGNTIGLSMKIVLNDSLTDNSALQFKIDRINHGFVSSTEGSGIITELTDDIVSGIFTLTVEADTILWFDIPDTVFINSNFSLTAIAADNKGNIDKDFSFPANLVLNAGAGNPAFNSLAFVSGKLNADSVSHDKAENIVIQLSSQSLSSANRYISVILNRNSSVENPSHQILGTTITSDATSIESEVPVFRFVIKDHAVDNVPTFVNELRFENPLSETNWSNVIDGISLYNGEQRLITNIIDQKKDYIRVGLFPGSLTVGDGEETEITLNIWLKTKVADKTVLVFHIPATNHGCKAAQNGSLFSDNFTQNIVSDTFSIEVQATKIIFKTAPANVVPDDPFSVEINAVNDDGTIDIDETGEVALALVSDNGSLSSVSGMKQQLVKGKIVWNDLTINMPLMFKIKAGHTRFGEITSGEIASMDTDSEVLPVLSQQKSIFKSTDTSINAAKEVIRFKIRDKGTNDGLPVIIDKMVFGTISEIFIPDLIAGAALLSDGQNISVSLTSAEDQITVIPDSLIIPDGESREIILKIFLNRPKCVDGSKLQLYIPAAAHGWTVNQNSSQLLKTFEYPIYSEIHSIDVEASQLTILNQPMIVLKNTPFSLNIGATDYMGNVDTSFINSISILKSDGLGELQSLHTTQFAGISTFNAIYDSLGDFSIKGASANMAETVSMPIYSANAMDTVVKSGMSAWNNTGDWSWNGNKLKHNSGDGFSYVSAPMDIEMTKGIVQWDFTVENGNFDPSSDNAFWCVLSSDRDDFEDDNLSAYIAGVNYTGSSDLISVWKVKAGSKQLLWSGNYDWNANTTVRIIIQKSENEWEIFMQEKDRPILFAGKFSDNESFANKFSGFVFKYTSTRNGMFSINNYEVIKTNLPLTVSGAEIIDKNNIQISFNTNIAFPQASSLDNYLLTSIFDTFEIFSADKISDNEIRLHTELLGDTLFLLSISGITDISGSKIKDTILELRRSGAQANCSFEALSRTRLVLEFNRNMVDSIITNTDNYLLTNVSGDTFSIQQITKNAGKFYIDCDSLRGSAFVLYYNNLETEDGFILSDSVLLNKSYLPAKIVKAEALSPSTVVVEFNKNISEAGNYSVENMRGTVFDVVSKTIDGKRVTLTLSETLLGNSFTVHVDGARDSEDFTVSDSAYFRYQTVSFGDLVFSEIMAKPNPPVALPDREYLELYNRTGDTVYLTDFRILYGAGKSSRITAGKIAPHGYVIVCASASVSELSAYGDAFSATSFPSLLDAGMVLTLTSSDSTVVAVVEYGSPSYGDDAKSKGGWSLERIDPDNLSDNGNWKAS